MAETLRRCRPLLGTFVTIEAVAGGDAVEAAFAAIARVHELMSFHSPASDLARLREARWGSRVAVAPETTAVLRYAARLHVETNGLFDVTVAARLVATDFLPRPEGIDLRRMTGTAADIEIEDGHVRCHRPLLIDLGGIAKGYAVDVAVDALLAGGAEEGIVDAGGDLRAFGAPRTIAIRDADGAVRRGVTIADAAVATSSNRHSARRRRGAVATPHVGRARQAILAPGSVTVIAASCMTADAFTKVAMADRALAGQLLPAHDGALLDAAPAALAA